MLKYIGIFKLIYFLKLFLIFVSAEPKFKLEQTIELCNSIDKIIGTKHNRDEKIFKTNQNNPAGIIISPFYPYNYSKNHECVLNLKAPKNHIVKLKFDDNFHLEPSNNCVYDYVEVRDGPHGYSPFIGRYCGEKAPQEVLSTGRELWLRFNSDDSIELTGFRAIYEFIPNQQSYYMNGHHKNRLLECELYRTNENYQKTGDGIITDDDVHKLFSNKLNELRNKLVEESDNAHFLIDDNFIECTVNIEVEKNEKIFLVFEKMNISKHTEGKTPNEIKLLRQNCTDNFIQLYDGSTSVVDRKFHFCTSDTNKLYKSKTNKLFIRYFLHKNTNADFIKFKLTYNPFKTGPCEDSQFDCLDNTCINATLICNGKRNCNHSVDEAGCPQILESNKEKKPSWTPEQRLAFIHKIIISVVGSILGIVITVSIFISCKRSLKDSKRKRKEYETLKLMNNKLNVDNDNYIICSNSSLDSTLSKKLTIRETKTNHDNYLINQTKPNFDKQMMDIDNYYKKNIVNDSIQLRNNLLKNDLNKAVLNHTQLDTNPDNYSLNLSEIDTENEQQSDINDTKCHVSNHMKPTKI